MPKRVRTKCQNPATLHENEEMTENNSETVTTGTDTKELEEKCIKVAETGTILTFFLDLVKEGVGTHPIESRARKFMLEHLSKEG